jgi:hypothetical protein
MTPVKYTNSKNLDLVIAVGILLACAALAFFILNSAVLAAFWLGVAYYMILDFFKPNKKTVQLNIPEETKRVLEVLAEASGMTLEEYVKKTLDAELKGKERKVVLEAVDREIVEKLQKASGLYK